MGAAVVAMGATSGAALFGFAITALKSTFTFLTTFRKPSASHSTRRALRNLKGPEPTKIGYDGTMSASGNKKELSETVDAVWTAFEKVPYPGDRKLISHDCSECDAVRNAFLKGKERTAWRERPLELFREERHDTALLTPEAFLYFLPLLVSATLQDYEESAPIPEHLVFSFLPRNWKPNRDSEKERKGSFKIAPPSSDSPLTLMNPKQREALASAIEMLKKNHNEDFSDEEISVALRALRAF